MTIETSLKSVVGPLLTGGLWPDVAPYTTTTPYATYTQVGGDAINYLNGAVPGRRYARIQINVWAKTREQANTVMGTIEDAVRASPLNATVLGALIARYNEIDGNRGAQQDFGFFG